jgi:aryl-alcohol dehydrogenase-like predicted oxidoreductase
MKVFAQGHIFNKKGIKTAWEPLSYALSQPVSTVIVGCDNVQQLEENIAIAKSFRPLNKAELSLIEKKTKSYIRQAQFFRKKYGGYDSVEKLETPLFQ